MLSRYRARNNGEDREANREEERAVILRASRSQKKKGRIQKLSLAAAATATASKQSREKKTQSRPLIFKKKIKRQQNTAAAAPSLVARRGAATATSRAPAAFAARRTAPAAAAPAAAAPAAAPAPAAAAASLLRRSHHRAPAAAVRLSSASRLSSTSSPKPLRPLSSSAPSATATSSEPETFQYQAEVDRLMDMIVNSLYSNREVFLRELVSNASDALDKARFNTITDGRDAGELRIRVRGDAESKTIVIEDTGVGMSREELLSSLGTIARSGTAKFAEAVKDANGDAALIGQFGVGFYSAFLVADRVTVTSRSSSPEAGGKAWQWESSAGSHSFSVKEVAAGDDLSGGGGLERGTRVTLHLKEDAAGLAEPSKLSALLKQYSEFISFPIELWTSKTVYDDVEDVEATKKAQEAADAAAKAEEPPRDKADPVAPVMTAKPRVEFAWARQNDSAPLWTRSPKEVERSEYNTFFKTSFKEFLDPLSVAHFSVEGTIEFTALLYVPSMAPFEQQDWLKPSRNVKLFVKRVFISDEFDEDLLPRWASFVRGVVDSADLPLNVSREILQESRVVRTIRRQLVKRTIEMLKEIAARPANSEKDNKDNLLAGGNPTAGASSDYDAFWAAFGKFVKLGAIEDEANKQALAPLLRFSSSRGGGAAKASSIKDFDDEEEDTGAPLVSLDDYVSRMKPGQKGIFYIAADSLAAAAGAPFVERLVQKGYEVLYLTEPIDEPALNAVGQYSGHDFVDVTREGLELGDGEEEKLEREEADKAEKGELRPLLDAIAKALGPERVEKASVSTRLANSPCALVTSKFGWSAYQERVMRAQPLGDTRAAEYMKGKKTFEVNPTHPVILGLLRRVDAARGEFDADGKKAVELLYDAALVTSGFTVESPREFASRIFDMIGLAVGNGEGGEGKEEESGGGRPEEKEVEVV